MSPQSQLTLFESLVMSILSYGCEVWGFCIADPIEKKIHLKFLKEISGIRQNTPTCFVYGKLVVFPLLLNRKTRILKYWLQLIGNEVSDNNVIKCVYKDLYKIIERDLGATNWASLVRKILFSCEFGYVGIQQKVENKEVFIQSFSNRLECMYIQEWQGQMDSYNDIRFYKYIKLEFEYEKYVNYLN